MQLSEESEGHYWIKIKITVLFILMQYMDELLRNISFLIVF